MHCIGCPLASNFTGEIWLLTSLGTRSPAAICTRSFAFRSCSSCRASSSTAEATQAGFRQPLHRQQRRLPRSAFALPRGVAHEFLLKRLRSRSTFIWRGVTAKGRARENIRRGDQIVSHHLGAVNSPKRFRKQFATAASSDDHQTRISRRAYHLARTNRLPFPVHLFSIGSRGRLGLLVLGFPTLKFFFEMLHQSLGAVA